MARQRRKVAHQNKTNAIKPTGRRRYQQWLFRDRDLIVFVRKAPGLARRDERKAMRSWENECQTYENNPNSFPCPQLMPHGKKRLRIPAPTICKRSTFHILILDSNYRSWMEDSLPMKLMNVEKLMPVSSGRLCQNI